jgi:hypothetical protein
MISLTRIQGWYYLLGGLWPFAHFRSFRAVAGPKPDRFQTDVASVLFAAIGAAIIAGSRRDGLEPRTRLLAASSAAGAAYVDWRHRGRIRPIFWLEAACEAVFAVAAATARGRGSGGTTGEHRTP